MPYMTKPSGKQTSMKCNNPAGMAAAMASVECHRRNMRSTKCIRLQEPAETTNGSARASTSRPPQGRVHQLPTSGLVMKHSAAGRISREKRHVWGVKVRALEACD